MEEAKKSTEGGKGSSVKLKIPEQLMKSYRNDMSPSSHKSGQGEVIGSINSKGELVGSIGD